MKALVIPRFGVPEMLELRDLPDPVPGPGEEVVKIEAAGVNFADIMTAQGGYPTTPPPPIIAGREFAGTLERTGTRVMGYTQMGAFAECLAARSDLLWPQPASWSVHEAAAFPVNYFTAYLAYWKAGLVDSRSGEKPARVLIHAVAGGVGTAAVEIGKILGVEMYGTSSSDEKLARVQELGLQHAINYKKSDYEAAIKDLTSGEGVDVVFEMLGGEHTAKSLRCVRDFGRVILYGTATGKQPQFDTRAMYEKASSVHGLWLSRLAFNKKVMDAAWQHLSAWIHEGKVRPIVGHTFPLAKVGEAFRLMLERKNFGKIVIDI